VVSQVKRCGLVGFAGPLACLALCLAAPALAQEPIKNLHSDLRAIRPPVPGLALQVVQGDRYLDLGNTSGGTVLVKGYDYEPYLRFLPNRIVQVNLRSPTKYVNEDRFGLTPVPAQADSKAAPKWRTVSTNGRYRWFDHRIHFMSKGIPPQVKDRGRRTKIFDWRVPMVVDGRAVHALGTLTWVPSSSSGAPVALIVGLIALAVLLTVALVAFLLRRRRGATGGRPRGRKAIEEAW
jgi:hypothetical protein